MHKYTKPRVIKKHTYTLLYIGSPTLTLSQMGWGLRVREGLLSGDFINRRLRCSQIYLLPLHPKSWDAPNKGAYTKAPVAELADALDLGSSVLRRAGSIPVRRTTYDKEKTSSEFSLFYFCKYL